MTIEFNPWVFYPTQRRTEEQNKVWWEACFQDKPAIASLTNSAVSCMLATLPGNGKSVAIHHLKQQLADDTFFVDYPCVHWPNSERPFLAEKGHIPQIFAAASNEIIRLIEKAPEKFHQLNDLQIEFFYWLIEAYLGRRTLARLIYRVNRFAKINDKDIEIPQEIPELYSSNPMEADIWGLIGEFVDVIQAFGFKQVVIVFDLNLETGKRHLSDLLSLFSWLDLLEFPDFSIRATAPADESIHKQLMTQASGRLNLVNLHFSQEEIIEIANRHIQLATNHQLNALEDIAERDVLEKSHDMILSLYGHMTLAGYINLVETLLVEYQTTLEPAIEFSQIAEVFYQRNVLLKLDAEQQGVWQGPKFISLDNQPFEIMTKLFELKGRSSPESLISLAGSSANLNTLMSRLRKKIEPAALFKRNIYIQNRRDQGYWLENFIDS